MASMPDAPGLVPLTDEFSARLDRAARQAVQSGQYLPVPARRPMVAAARAIEDRTRAEREANLVELGAGLEGWQASAVQAFRIPELHRAATFVGDAMSRLRWFPAIRPNADDDPVALDTTLTVGEGDSAHQVPVVTDAERIEIEDAWARLVEGSRGGMAELMRQMAVNLFQLGECYLVGSPSTPDELADGQRDEEWYIASIVELTLDRNGKWVLKPSRKAMKPRTLPADSAVNRLWVRDPFHSESADAPLSAMVVETQELLWLTRAIMSRAKQRNLAGVFVVSQEATLPQRADTGLEDPPMDELEEAWLYHVETALSDPDSVSNGAPFFLRLPESQVDKAKWIKFDNPYEGQAEERHELILRLLRGADVPLENIIGLGDTSTYANAKLVTQQTYDTHLAPKAEAQAEALAESYLRRELRTRGLPPSLVRRVCVGADPSKLVGRPEQAANAKDAYDRREADGTWLRTSLGIPEDARPSQDERMDPASAGIAASMVAAGYDGTAVLEALGLPDIPWTAPSSGGGGMVASAAAQLEPGVVASPAGDRFSARLARIEANAKARVTTLMSALTVRAAEKLGAQASNRAKRDTDIAATLRGVPLVDVPRTLGTAMIASLGLDEEETLRSVFASGEAEVVGALRQAHRAVTATVAASTSRAWLDDEELEELEAQQDDDSNAAWVWLLAAAPTLAAAWIFGDSAGPVSGLAAPIGEFDPNLHFPPGPINTVFSIAGGSTGELTSGGLITGQGTPAPGIADGPINAPGIARAGWLQVAFEWVVGAPQRPFDPHQELSGFEFTTWDDPGLVNSEGWPESPIYRPGDHLGCQCDVIPSYTQQEGEPPGPAAEGGE